MVADARVALSCVVDFGTSLACLDDVVLDCARSSVGAGRIVSEAAWWIARMASMFHVQLALASMRGV